MWTAGKAALLLHHAVPSPSLSCHTEQPAAPLQPHHQQLHSAEQASRLSCSHAVHALHALENESGPGGAATARYGPNLHVPLAGRPKKLCRGPVEC